jgi:hypothetical protein
MYNSALEFLLEVQSFQPLNAKNILITNLVGQRSHSLSQLYIINRNGT